MPSGSRHTVVLLVLLSVGIVSGLARTSFTNTEFKGQWLREYPAGRSGSQASSGFFRMLSEAALERTEHEVRYVPDYVRIPYPMGDVPDDTGGCLGVVVRAYRALGVDLLELVHEDMTRNFGEYPRLWRLRHPDANIDHRRVPNLMTLLKRMGAAVPVTDNAEDYLPGDFIAWDLSSGLWRIGIVVDRRSSDGRWPLIVHNIGAGPQLEDPLFSWPVIGHFRYGGRRVDSQVFEKTFARRCPQSEALPKSEESTTFRLPRMPSGCLR